jgi:hypothetical protein
MLYLTCFYFVSQAILEEVEVPEVGQVQLEGAVGGEVEAEAELPRRRSTRSNPGILVPGLEPTVRSRRSEAAAVPAAPLNTPVSKSNIYSRVG